MVVDMPSWKVHKEVCEKLLGFYNQEIDQIIDSEVSHDASRYDIDALARVIEYVESKYGCFGLKQIIMHHYLDRLSDIVVREFILYFDLYPPEKAVFEFVNSVREMIDKDPANILNLIIYPYDHLRYIAGVLYSGKRKRRKRKEIEQRLENAQRKLSAHLEVKNLSHLILEIVGLIKTNLKFILLSIFLNDEKMVVSP